MRVLAAVLMSFLPPAAVAEESVLDAEIEIRPRHASSVGVASILSMVNDQALFVAYPGSDPLLDHEPRKVGLRALRKELLDSLGLQVREIAHSDVALPAGCDRKFEPARLEIAGKVSIFFTDIEAGALLRMAAEAGELEAVFPDGLPRNSVAISFHDRPVSELVDALRYLTGAELKVVGKKLEIRRGKLPRGCVLARERWLPRDTAAGEAPAPEPAFATSGKWARGYIAFSSRAPVNVIVLGEAGYYPGSTGDSIDANHSIAAVNREIVEIRTKKKNEDDRPGYYVQFDLHTGERLAGESSLERGNEGGWPHEWLERYALEDLTIESTQRVDGKWRAMVRDPHGLLSTVREGNYLGPQAGKITAISAAGVTVTQIVPTKLGGYREASWQLIVGERFEYPRDKLRRELLVKVNDTPLQREFSLAAQNGEVESLAALLERGAQIDSADGKHGLNALCMSMVGTRSDAFLWLLEHGASPNVIIDRDNENTPLIAAVRMRTAKAVATLLEAGADPNLSNADAQTPLHEAVGEGGTLAVIRLLLDRGANPTLRDFMGLTPPILAALHGRLDMVELFLDRGIDVDAPGEGDVTMLEAAVYGEHEDLARFLIARGSSVEVLWGERSLFRGALDGASPAIVRLLEKTRARQKKTTHLSGE